MQKPTQPVQAFPSQIAQSVAPVAPVQPSNCTGLDCQIIAAAKKAKIETKLVKSVIRTESHFKSDAVSHAGAIGLMQVMPNHLKYCDLATVTELKEIEKNLACGTKLLKDELVYFDRLKTKSGARRFTKDAVILLAAAAYNAGRPAIIRYKNQVPPYKETKRYAAKVFALYKMPIKGGVGINAQALDGGFNHIAILLIALDFFENSGYEVKYFSAFNDLYHQKKHPNSKHVKGLAFDLVLNNPADAKATAQWIKKKYSYLFVKDEYSNPNKYTTGGHVHVHFKTKALANEKLPLLINNFLRQKGVQ